MFKVTQQIIGEAWVLTKVCLILISVFFPLHQVIVLFSQIVKPNEENYILHVMQSSFVLCFIV